MLYALPLPFLNSYLRPCNQQPCEKTEYYSVMQSDGRDFAEMSSRTALTRHLGFKATF